MDLNEQIKELLKQAVNPLHSFAIIAQSLQEALRLQIDEHDDSYPLLPHASRFEKPDDFPVIDGKPAYPNRDLGGVAGLYGLLLEKNLEVIFANDLALEQHCIDAVAYDKARNCFVLCEAKGTTASKIRHPGRYLAKTRHKGRQFSWRWCWQSLVDFAEVATTAGLFLELVEPFLEGRVERLLCVSRLQQVGKEQFVLLDERQCWEEPQLNEIPWLAASHDLDKQRGWWVEICNLPS